MTTAPNVQDSTRKTPTPDTCHMHAVEIYAPGKLVIKCQHGHALDAMHVSDWAGSHEEAQIGLHAYRGCPTRQDDPPDDEPPAKAAHTRHVEPKLAAAFDPYLAGCLDGQNGASFRAPLPTDWDSAEGARYVRYYRGFWDGHSAKCENFGGEAA